MTDTNRSLQELPALLTERRKYEKWLLTLDARRDTTPGHVFERVKADYTGRLERVDEELAVHRQAVNEERSSLHSRRSLLEAEEQLRLFGKLNGQNGDAKVLLARGMADPAQRAAAVSSLENSPDNADIRRDPIWYAFYLTSLRERGRALDELEIYAAKRNSAFEMWLWNRGFDPLRDDSRFKAVLAKLALPYTPPANTEP